jgi:hypothetical protein
MHRLHQLVFQQHLASCHRLPHSPALTEKKPGCSAALTESSAYGSRLLAAHLPCWQLLTLLLLQPVHLQLMLMLQR